jgi:hypothetical protein
MTPEHLAEVQMFCQCAQVMAEGGREFVYLPGLNLPIGHVLDGLLCLGEHGGYTTRLFLSQQVARGQNWNPSTILGRTWWSPSFQSVAATLRPIQILDAHLELYR